MAWDQAVISKQNRKRWKKDRINLKTPAIAGGGADAGPQAKSSKPAADSHNRMEARRVQATVTAEALMAEVVAAVAAETSSGVVVVAVGRHSLGQWTTVIAAAKPTAMWPITVTG